MATGALGGAGQLAQGAALPGTVSRSLAKVLVPATTQLGPVDRPTTQVVDASTSVSGVLAPLLVGGGLLAGVLLVSARERRRRIERG